MSPVEAQSQSGRISATHLPFIQHSDPPEREMTISSRPYSPRTLLREIIAEFLGTMFLVMFGTGANCQGALSANPGVASSPKGSFLTGAFGWAVGVAAGVFIAGGISGGHVNPAVTLALAAWRDFPWRKVPFFVLAQILGAFAGAGVVYANYFHAIDIVEGGRDVRTLSTGSLFATYPLDYMTNVSAFFSEFAATAVLVFCIFSATDKHNSYQLNGLLPVILFLVILGIALALGMETSYAINPARDLGPRIFTSMVGYGRAVYSFRSQYWLWCPIIAPLTGGLVGGLLYELTLKVKSSPEDHHDELRDVDTDPV